VKEIKIDERRLERGRERKREGERKSVCVCAREREREKGFERVREKESSGERSRLIFRASRSGRDGIHKKYQHHSLDMVPYSEWSPYFTALLVQLRHPLGPKNRRKKIEYLVQGILKGEVSLYR